MDHSALILNQVALGGRHFRGDCVARVPTEVTAAERARWLADLSEALDAAQELIWRMGASLLEEGDALDLWATLEGARAEARALRFARAGQRLRQHDPQWTNHSVWNCRTDTGR